jgi:hypothetical protein
MRYSLENLADGADISIANVTNTTLGPSALIDKRTTRAFFADQDGVTGVSITVDLGSIQTIDLVALVALTTITSVDVTLRLASADVASETISVDTPVQQSYAAARFQGVSADEIVIEFDVGDATQFSIGYLFAGELSTAIEVASEALSYSVASAYPRNITRAGVPLTSSAYLRAEIQAGLVELPFTEFRAHLVTLGETGFASPRVWYFDEACILENESIYAILDSDAPQLDARYDKPKASAVANITLLEVF